jgi:chlorophyll synthase
VCQLILTLMSVTTDLTPAHDRSVPEPRAVLTLLKPITWFPADVGLSLRCRVRRCRTLGPLAVLILGVILAGPIVCGMSQAANDWCDRHVDAINEPDRPIPSGRIPGRWGLWIAIAMSVLAAFIGLALGPGASARHWSPSPPPGPIRRSPCA